MKTRLARGLSKGAGLSLEGAQRVAPAKTVSSSLRVRHHLRRADVDVDALDATQQRRLGRLLNDADPSTARALRRMDGDSLDELTSLDVSPDVRRKLAPKYAKLDRPTERRLTSFIDNHGDAEARVAGDIDSDRLDDLFPDSCTIASPSVGGAILDDSKLYSLQDPSVKALQSSGSCPGAELIETVADDSTLTGADLDDLLTRLDDNQVKPFANSVIESNHPQEYLEDLNPIAVRRMANEGDNGVFRKVSRTYDKFRRYGDNYETGSPDDLAEIHGEVLLESKLGEEYRIVSQAEIDWSGTSETKEVDHLLIKDRKVVGYAETKDSSDIDPSVQIGKTKRGLRNFGVEEIRYPGSSDPVEADMSTTTVIDDRIYSIGDGSGYDIDSLSQNTFEALYDGFQN